MFFSNIRTFLFALSSLLLVAAPAAAADFSNIRIIAAEFPPYSYREGKALQGPAIEKIQAVLADLGLTTKIELYPWARAYHLATTQPGALLFSVARTKKREALFQWVGRIVSYDVKLFRLSRRSDIRIDTLQDLAKYRVGGLINDVKTNYLSGKGIPVETYGDEENGIRMLLRDRLDLMPADAVSFVFRLNRLGHSLDRVTVAYDLPDISRPLYAAFHKDTAADVVDAFRAALRREGEVPLQDREIMN